MARLDQDRQKDLEPKRIIKAIKELKALDLNPRAVGNELQFEYKGSVVKFYPYTGWASGKTIKDGRGLDHLLNQLKSGVHDEK